MARQEFINLNTIQADVIIQTLKSLGVVDYHSSPGLRNAPLLDAIARDCDLNLYSHFDERANGYRALAQAKCDSKIIAILCTSGTAVANFLPAIIESFFQEIPLLILSTDRPQFAVEGLANQSIYQDGIFGKYTPVQMKIGGPTTKMNIKELNQEISKKIQEGQKISCPIHINISFLDPADTNENSVPIECASTLLSDYKKMVYTNFPYYTKEPNDSYFDLKEVSRPDLISVGELPLDTQNELKITLINFLNKCTVPFTIDVTSQIKYDLLGAPYAIPSIDHPEVKEWLSLQEIKTVWHFGERLTSKRYYQLLKEKNVKIINFSNSRLNFNPSLCRKEQIPLNSEIINSFQEIQFKRKILPDFSSLIELKRSIIEDNPLSFPYISKKIIEEHVSSDDLMVLANSTCIRSFDFFASMTKNASANIYCHRGASGIEGYFASLIGINDSKKIKSHGKIVAILGDITALHDFNSLLLMQEIVPQVRIDIFIINDSGGGIFRLLNVPELLRCKQEMETPHKTNFFKVLRTIFENNKYVNIQQINCKSELLKLLNKEQDQQKQCMNFYEIVLDQEENKKVYQCLKTISMDSKS